ncbi:hypothetical protein KFL_000460080 [Klebsormidium nitens]|uniref:Uncharacterized protein n=1 Tax=Klebsormidium nitens TaxID=105231 RepID=A0A1Y1HU82_KLENI|nr:hypothetical protein KFL_000460080 [Klebsormidium nitens]|eukprot:GAQ80097.1 hypothetical protein KFL_000460080 [Klebsormidium nitens]
MEPSEASEKRLETLNTAEKLQCFFEALKGLNKAKLQKSDLCNGLDGYEDQGLLQFLELLAATYEKKGSGRGFCSIICSLMTKWTSEEAQQSLDEEELVDAMFDGWTSNGAVSVIPDDLLSALQQEFKSTLFFAADSVLGSARPKMITSGMKLTKVLTAMYAIQVHMHTAASSVSGLEPRWEKLCDVVLVDSLSRFALPDGWGDTLQQAAKQEQDRKPFFDPDFSDVLAGLRPRIPRGIRRSEAEAQIRRRIERNRILDGPVRAKCGKGMTERILAIHKCQGPKRTRKAGADTTSLPSDDSRYNDEPEAGTEVSNRQETSGEAADQADQAAPPEQEAASGGTAEHQNEGDQEENVGEAAVVNLAGAFQGEMKKMLEAAARLVAKSTQWDEYAEAMVLCILV